MEMDENKLKVLIVDDHPLYRKAIRRLLANIPFVEYTAEAENGQAALELMEKEFFDVVLLDLMMPVLDGEQTARIIRKHYPRTKIIILTMSDSKNQMIKMLKLGVLGYVLKSTDEAELRNAIFNVREGSSYLSEEVRDVWDEFISDKNNQDLVRQYEQQEKREISEREAEILRLLCRQKNSKEIALALQLSEHTVNTHRKNLMSRLGIENVVGLAVYAIKHGIYVP